MVQIPRGASGAPITSTQETDWRRAPWAVVPIPFPESLAQRLGVEIRKDGVEGPFERLQAGVVELWSVVAHASDFLRLPDTVDDEGFEIIQAYIAGVADRISEGLSHAADLWMDAFEDVRETDGWTARSWSSSTTR